MTVLKRLVNGIRAEINRWIQQDADPEVMLDQALMEMQSDLIQLRQSVAQAIATQKRTERQREQARTLAQECYGRAALALQNGADSQAREALAKRQAHLQMLAQWENNIQAQQAVVIKLKGALRDLDIKLREVRTRRDMYVARARSAEASQRIQDMIGRVGNRRSLGILSDMENKIENLEAQSEAMAELNQLSETQGWEAKSEVLKAADISAVEAELNAMKLEFKGRPQPKQSGEI